jgi:uncharacterized protein (TIGR02246 family)
METVEANIIIENLYLRLLDSWNKMDARQFAGLFIDNGQVIGFDGSQMDGRTDIENQLGAIFSDHTVASYIGIVKQIRFLSSDIALLRAVAGMVPPGKNDINPRTNAIQTMIAQKQGDEFLVVLYQNTPAVFHGRPEASEDLTSELRSELLRSIV